ncbi:MAG: hypothetical protein JNL79_03810 [Myxococcales bacterium]|nr:hypothetical protein [Myxococcales bacterium]
MLPLVATPAGLLLSELGLHLDPSTAVPHAFVSHAHADHARAAAGGTIYCSPETAALLAARGPIGADVVTLDWDRRLEMRLGGEAVSLSLAPSGHVLGAAQLIVDHARHGRLVYTGDYRTGPGDTHATGAPVACDALVIESTFALPIFAFPDRAATLASIVEWCRATLAAGQTPVLLAWALGKAQALIHALLAAALPVMAHGAVHRMCAAYEALGIPLGVADGRLRAYADVPKKERAVLVTPPRTRATPMVDKRKDARIALVSGWAMVDAAVEQRRADAGFALSDHADHDDLVATVKTTGARQIVCTHGDGDALAHVLVTRHALVAGALDVAAIDTREEAIG